MGRAGGAYDHVAPDPAAPPGEFGFTFDRSGYRVPGIMVSPWVESGAVYNEEYRHTSLIATLRKSWDLGPAFTQRDAQACTFDHVFTRETPRHPDAWVAVEAAPVPDWALDYDVLGKALSHLGKAAGTGLIEKARAMGATLPPELDDPTTELTPGLIIKVLRDAAWNFFPRLAPVVTSDSP